jgi:hypothetical protein
MELSWVKLGGVQRSLKKGSGNDKRPAALRWRAVDPVKL